MKNIKNFIGHLLTAEIKIFQEEYNSDLYPKYNNKLRNAVANKMKIKQNSN